MREKEVRLKDITGHKIKIVEKSGMKLEDIIAGKNSWRGADCRRPNCFICNTKTLTGKNMKKDCTRRNVLYEIKCLTCEEREIEKIQDDTEGDEKEKRRG